MEIIKTKVKLLKQLNYAKTIPELTKFKIQDHPEAFVSSKYGCLTREILRKSIFFQKMKGLVGVITVPLITLCNTYSIIYTDSPYYYYRLSNNGIEKLKI